MEDYTLNLSDTLGKVTQLGQRDGVGVVEQGDGVSVPI